MTIYQILQESKIKFNKTDCAKIGAIVVETSPEPFLVKIEQTEVYNGEVRNFKVRNYSDGLKNFIQEVATKYFTSKYSITVK